MYLKMLKGKIHRAVVKQAELHYVGSITVDPELMAAAGILEYENERGIHRLSFGFGRQIGCRFPEYDQYCVSSAAWCDRYTLYICTWLVDECVAAIHFKLVFSEDGMLTVLMRKTEETKFNEFQGILTAEEGKGF